MRGKPGRGLSRKGRPRIIPARAGQTTSLISLCGGDQDHPRACGANVRRTYGASQSPGSSPRVRGKPARVQRTANSTRIIPARAGQTTLMPNISAQITDHPRACGANDNLVVRRRLEGGSSPRVRGKLQCCPRTRLAPRIIPARAGQT